MPSRQPIVMENANSALKFPVNFEKANAVNAQAESDGDLGHIAAQNKRRSSNG
jgi:hypothetical protein